MDEVERLQRRADQKRNEFLGALSEANARLSGGAIVKEILHQTGLDQWTAGKVVKSVGPRPVLTVAAAAASALLAWKVWGYARPKSRGGRAYKKIAVRTENENL